MRNIWSPKGIESWVDGESRAVNVCFPSTEAVCLGTNEGRKLVKESFFDGDDKPHLHKQPLQQRPGGM